MRSPYKIEGPAVISFSGGRTSGYMLRKCLDEGLGEDVHVVFADTGKERPETYDFVRECSERWGVEVHWVSRPGGFEKLIRDRKFLPNPVARMCTSDLKVKEIQRFMQGRGYDFWTMVVGLRHDEPGRVAKKRNAVDRYWDYTLPLAQAKVTEREVIAFWEAQPFGLDLRQDEGNCDLCFLKGRRKLVAILADRPELADWWIAREREIGARFRKEYSYEDLLDEAQRVRSQLELGVDVRLEHVYRRPRAAKRVAEDKSVQLALDALGLEDDARPCMCTD